MPPMAAVLLQPATTLNGLVTRTVTSDSVGTATATWAWSGRTCIPVGGQR